MLASGIPYKFQYVWGQNATAGFVTDPIPASSSGPIASQSLGFPPLTATQKASGGTPPNIADWNGLAFYLSAWAQWMQAGGPVGYDATFSTNNGGYPAGAILSSSGGSHQWLSTVDNNTSDPDTGGANWTNISAGRLLNVQYLTSSGTYTPTPGANRALVRGVAGGGAGGGIAATGGGAAGAGGGGGAGESGELWISSGLTGQSVTIGAGGTPASGTTGGNGGNTIFGSLMTLSGGQGGGSGGAFSSAAVSSSAGAGGGGGSGGSILFGGESGSAGLTLSASSAISGAGASSPFGPGGAPIGINATAGEAGNAAGQHGGGGGGGVAVATGGAVAGGAGAAGILIVYEFS